MKLATFLAFLLCWSSLFADFSDEVRHYASQDVDGPQLTGVPLDDFVKKVMAKDKPQEFLADYQSVFALGLTTYRSSRQDNSAARALADAIVDCPTYQTWLPTLKEYLAFGNTRGGTSENPLIVWMGVLVHSHLLDKPEKAEMVVKCVQFLADYYQKNGPQKRWHDSYYMGTPRIAAMAAERFNSWEEVEPVIRRAAVEMAPIPFTTSRFTDMFELSQLSQESGISIVSLRFLYDAAVDYMFDQHLKPYYKEKYKNSILDSSLAYVKLKVAEAKARGPIDEEKLINEWNKDRGFQYWTYGRRTLGEKARSVSIFCAKVAAVLAVVLPVGTFAGLEIATQIDVQNYNDSQSHLYRFAISDRRSGLGKARSEARQLVDDLRDVKPNELQDRIMNAEYALKLLHEKYAGELPPGISRAIASEMLYRRMNGADVERRVRTFDEIMERIRKMKPSMGMEARAEFANGFLNTNSDFLELRLEVGEKIREVEPKISRTSAIVNHTVDVKPQDLISIPMLYPRVVADPDLNFTRDRYNALRLIKFLGRLPEGPAAAYDDYLGALHFAKEKGDRTPLEFADFYIKKKKKERKALEEEWTLFLARIQPIDDP